MKFIGTYSDWKQEAKKMAKKTGENYAVCVDKEENKFCVCACEKIVDNFRLFVLGVARNEYAYTSPDGETKYNIKYCELYGGVTTW